MLELIYDEVQVDRKTSYKIEFYIQAGLTEDEAISRALSELTPEELKSYERFLEKRSQGLPDISHTLD